MQRTLTSLFPGFAVAAKRMFVEGDGEELELDPSLQPLTQLKVKCEGLARVSKLS
jgi:hypothetical protein